MNTHKQLVITSEMTAIRRQYLADIQLGAITLKYDMPAYSEFCRNALDNALEYMRALSPGIPDMILVDFLRNG